MAQVELGSDSYQPNWLDQERQNAGQPQPLNAGALDQAKAIYGSHWDADAQQDFTNRSSQGQSLADILKHTQEDASARFPGGSGGGTSRVQVPGFQFDDPYTKQLEGIAQNQMGEVRNNPGLNQLMAELTKQFTQLSSAPGFSPEDMALLNTQAFEPIEQNRQASNQRALQRAASGGYLPTSGITYAAQSPTGGVETNDVAYDRMRAAAGRDVALRGIDQRRADQARALQIGQTLGLTIPQGQRSEELDLSNLLYNLPRNALNDSLSVLSRTPSSNDLFSQLLQLSQNNRTNQLDSNDQNAQLAAALGQLFGNIF